MYYDVHTHRPNSTCNDIIAIMNIFQNFDRLPNEAIMSLGIHPWYLDGKVENDLEMIKRKVVLSNIWAIGECGMDVNVDLVLSKQAEIFETQISIAQAVSKPILIHCVRTFQEILKLVDKVSVPVIFHGVNNKATIIEPVINAGHYLSFGKSLLKPTPSIVESLYLTPLNKLLLETDDSGRSIIEIYNQAAKILNIKEKSLVLQIEKNFKTIFPQVCKI